MSAFLDKYPHFQLLETQDQAELALQAIRTHATGTEKQVLVPELASIERDFMLESSTSSSLISAVNNLLAGYLDLYGELSDSLLIFLSQELALSNRVNR